MRNREIHLFLLESGLVGGWPGRSSPLQHLRVKMSSQGIDAAQRFAEAAEELYEDGRYADAAERFETAAHKYVEATLLTKDTKLLQSLRQLAIFYEEVCTARIPPHSCILSVPCRQLRHFATDRMQRR